jgi:hypothetical protein
MACVSLFRMDYRLLSSVGSKRISGSLLSARWIVSIPYIRSRDGSVHETWRSRTGSRTISYRRFATQSEAIDNKTNGKQESSQLCDKIGFIGAGKIAQVTNLHTRPEWWMLTLCEQAIMSSLVRNGIQHPEKISVYDISIENAQYCNKNFGVRM